MSPRPILHSVGDTFIKYGQDIGRVVAAIRKGDHVHAQAGERLVDIVARLLPYVKRSGASRH